MAEQRPNAQKVANILQDFLDNKIKETPANVKLVEQALADAVTLLRQLAEPQRTLDKHFVKKPVKKPAKKATHAKKGQHK